MGMYDFVNGRHQIKCFYQPVVCHDMEALGLPRIDRLDMFTSGGAMYDYHLLSKVPYKTMWYDYTPNFMIFDPRYITPAGIVHIIRFGRYLCSINYSSLNTIIFPIGTVIDTNGDLLKISTKEDFEAMLTDYINCSHATERATPEEMGTAWEKFNEKWHITSSDISPWAVGGFLDGISAFCKTNEDVDKYITFFEQAHVNDDIHELLVQYALWCAHHDIPILLKDLRKLFWEDRTLAALSKVLWKMD